MVRKTYTESAVNFVTSIADGQLSLGVARIQVLMSGANYLLWETVWTIPIASGYKEISHLNSILDYNEIATMGNEQNHSIA